MSPFIPHFTSECLDNIEQSEISWPITNKEEMVEENINFVIQINGKKRALLKVKRNTNEKEIMSEIRLSKEIEKILKDHKIKKTVFVSNRLINIIL